jgi:RimJ/RimL family protein N-acetyltransferase
VAAEDPLPLIGVWRLLPEHAPRYRALMLEAYRIEPDAFTSTHAERAAQPAGWWAWRLAPGDDGDERVFGAWRDGALVGAVGWQRNRRERTAHKALLFGMYVDAAARRCGAGRALAAAVLADAAATPGLLLVQLTVSAGNEPARRLYQSLGFEAFGVEPMATRHGERFVDKVHMWRALDPAAGAPAQSFTQTLRSSL